MGEIRHTRYQALLRQAFALTERYAPGAIEDIMPVYPVEDPGEPHLQLAKESFIVFGGVVAVPAATDLATVDLGFQQPLSSNSMINVLQLSLNNPSAVAYNIILTHVGGIEGSAITQLTPLDGRRIGSEIQPQRSLWGLTGQIPGFIASTANGWRVIVPPGTGVVIPWRMTLYRSILRFQASAINAAMHVSVVGQERSLEPAEARAKITAAP